MPVALEVQDVSKVFTLRKVREMSIRQHLSQMVTGITQLDSDWKQQQFFALRQVSFSIDQGEAVGLVGRNGAGKSTLIRIISNIMRPTVGTVRVNGSYVSLLGIGTGFIQDLTGRKNIYLNAAIFGKSPAEVDMLLDEIIAFADIGAFIDVPVKDYSSGMQARLAFSIVIHLLTDIILLDEVLTVGDTAFQEKCMERILNLKREGRTLLFVSHSLPAIRLLCERTLWLHGGTLMMDGATDDVLQAYREVLSTD